MAYFSAYVYVSMIYIYIYIYIFNNNIIVPKHAAAAIKLCINTYIYIFSTSIRIYYTLKQQLQCFYSVYSYTLQKLYRVLNYTCEYANYCEQR
jgi:GTP1/Obg family GTP-binding protein